MIDILTRLMIDILNRPDRLEYALRRCRYHRDGWWDRIRLEIAKRIWDEWEDMG